MASEVISRKQQIYLVAQNLFMERGYAATSMRDLAKEVGIEPASLYSHIKSKEEILKNICFGMATEFFEVIQPILNLDVSPESKLRMAMENHVSVIARHLDASSVFFNEWRFLSEPELSEFKALRKNYENQFIKIIKQGIKQKLFKNIDVKIVVFTIFSSLNATYDIYSPKNKISPEETADQIANIIIDGLKTNHILRT